MSEASSIEKAIEDEWKLGNCFNVPWSFRSQFESNVDAIHKPELAIFARNVLKRYSEDERRIGKEEERKRLKERVELNFPDEYLTICPPGEASAIRWVLKILQED